MESDQKPEAAVAPTDQATPGAAPPTAATPDDLRFMRQALAQANKGKNTEGASPIGCVLVLDGQVIGEGHNEVGLRHDCTAHAEIVTIRRAGEKLGREAFRGATLYSTLQPCGMCTMACIWGSINRVVYGAERDQVHRMYFETEHLDTMNFIRDAYRDDMEIIGRVLGEECAALYYGPNDDPPQEEQGNI